MQFAKCWQRWLVILAERSGRAASFMILGIGVDIIEVSRIRDAYARLGDRFLRRILLDSEIAYCLAHSDPAPHLAATSACTSTPPAAPVATGTKHSTAPRPAKP